MNEIKHALRAFTPARVALERTGGSLATRELLEFNLAHAAARDAVHAALNAPAMLAKLRDCELNGIALRSAAQNRATYLRRPDLGRRLSDRSREQLSEIRCETLDPRSKLAIAITDGLSATAVENHAVAALHGLLPLIEADFAPPYTFVVEQGRVAIGDEIGELLKADLVLVLIGERPGLSSPDSLGAYITWAPRPDRTDAERNCVSNIRPEGLSYEAAARLIAWYLIEARRRQLTGIHLKPGDAYLSLDAER